MVVCANGHSFCSRCCAHIEVCAQCRQPCLAAKIVNISLLRILEPRAKALEDIPEIPNEQLRDIKKEPLASGSYSDVFLCTWKNQKTIIKKLRLNPKSDQLKEIKRETSLAISLLHPNIVRVYGTTRLMDGMMAIVMEFADMGDLCRVNMDKLSKDQKISVAYEIGSGISFLHSRRVAHRDLKPENVLLFGRKPVPKITDFGSSKVIQTMIQSTTMAGTVKYAAPELLHKGTVYGESVDIYSLAVILYELFSGEDAFSGYSLMQVMMAMSRQERPTFPEDFPPALLELVRSGWDEEPSNRCDIAELKEALQSMTTADLRVNTTSFNAISKATSVSAMNQKKETDRAIMPVSLISMKWPVGSDTVVTGRLREEMIGNIEQKSNMRNMITASVLKAMEMVPRHLFMEPSRVNGSAEEKLKNAYTYNKAMGATKTSNESSPEIIGSMLSLVKIETGASILLVGGKGGYINSVVAQVAGINGKVVTVTAREDILNTCKERVDNNSPLRHSMQWNLVSSVQDVDTLLHAFGDETFHAIIYCGSVPFLPKSLLPLLSSDGGSILAPVQLEEGRQQIQMLICSPEKDLEVRAITDFGVIFEEAK